MSINKKVESSNNSLESTELAMEEQQSKGMFTMMLESVDMYGSEIE